MSELNASDVIDNILEHHGVKGQKWGVRRNSSTGVRPIARTLNDSRFGQNSIRRAESHMTKQNQRAALKTTRLQSQQAVERARSSVAIKHPTNKDIIAARQAVAQGGHSTAVAKAKIQYKVAKAQYKVDKQTIGKTQAKIILEKNGKLGLQKARARRDAVYDVASHETTGEATMRFINDVFALKI